MKKVHRFIIETDLGTSLEIHDAQLLDQWAKVLKFKVGEEIELCDGRGKEATYHIVSLKKSGVTLERVGAIRKNQAESKVHATLYAAVLKKDLLELVMQKATECGVSEIVPLVTDRTVKKSVKLERLREIAKEAAEQSGRGKAPNIHEPLSVKAALAHAKMNAANYFFHVGDGKSEIFKGAKKEGVRIGLFIGPEGGWSDEEATSATAAGMITASLGPRVLIGETASIIAAFLAN